jgi:hypothetical protein
MAPSKITIAGAGTHRKVALCSEPIGDKDISLVRGSAGLWRCRKRVKVCWGGCGHLRGASQYEETWGWRGLVFREGTVFLRNVGWLHGVLSQKISVLYNHRYGNLDGMRAATDHSVLSHKISALYNHRYGNLDGMRAATDHRPWQGHAWGAVSLSRVGELFKGFLSSQFVAVISSYRRLLLLLLLLLLLVVVVVVVVVSSHYIFKDAVRMMLL